jgi:hypothetical protein
MTDPPVTHDFAYFHTDIPAGMTIREWRAQRAVERGIGGAVHRSWRRPLRATVAIVDAWLHVRRPRQHGTGREVRV